MARTTIYDVRCSGCDTETQVSDTHWPATRWEPPDGELSPEECPNCGKPWDDLDAWVEAEPPEPDPYDYLT